MEEKTISDPGKFTMADIANIFGLLAEIFETASYSPHIMELDSAGMDAASKFFNLLASQAVDCDIEYESNIQSLKKI